MDKKSLSFLILGLLIGAVLTTGTFSILIRGGDGLGGVERRVLKLAHSLPPAAPVHQGMVYMAKRAAELSGGRLEIQVFPSGQLGSETETIEQLQRGALAMVKTSTSPMEGFNPIYGVFSLPYLFRDSEHFWNVLNGEVGQEMLLKGLDVGIRGLCYYDSGARSFYTIDKPVLTPDDLRGMKIRVMRSQTQMQMINTMGGSPTPIPFGELYTALQQGIVDGAENNPPSMYDTRHWEVTKHYSLDEHSRIPDMVIFSEQIWQTLTPQEQAWLQEAADDSVVYQREVWDAYVEECMRRLQEEGVQVYYPDKGPFQEAVAGLLASFEGTEIGEMIDRIQAVE